MALKRVIPLSPEELKELEEVRKLEKQAVLRRKDHELDLILSHTKPHERTYPWTGHIDGGFILVERYD